MLIQQSNIQVLISVDAAAAILDYSFRSGIPTSPEVSDGVANWEPRRSAFQVAVELNINIAMKQHDESVIILPVLCTHNITLPRCTCFVSRELCYLTLSVTVRQTKAGH